MPKILYTLFIVGVIINATQAQTNHQFSEFLMKPFPSAYYSFKLIEDSSRVLTELKRNTRQTDTLVSMRTEKAFIGQVNEGGFQIISSKRGRGAFCVLTGQLIGKHGTLKIRVHKVFQILLSLILFMPIIGIVLVMYQQGLADSIRVVLTMIGALLLVRFVIIELTFNLISKIALNDLKGILGMTEMTRM